MLEIPPLSRQISNRVLPNIHICSRAGTILCTAGRKRGTTVSTIVVFAGWHRRKGTELADSLIGFALPRH